MPNYITRVWKTDDGLPQNSVTAVVQTRDGYLWLGTYNGLARFDGVRFTVFNGSNVPKLRDSRVTSLFEANDGVLWIGHQNGKVTSYKNGRFRTVEVPTAWENSKIFDIGTDEAGEVWLLNSRGELARVKDWFVIPPPPGKPAPRLALVRKPTGGFWIQRDNEVWELVAGQLQPVHFDEPTRNRYIQGVGASRDGGLWVMTESRMLKWKDRRWTEDLGPAPWGLAVVYTLIETKDGHLAAATSDHGLFLVFPRPGIYTILSHEWVSG